MGQACGIQKGAEYVETKYLDLSSTFTTATSHCTDSLHTPNRAPVSDGIWTI